ncbi:hypothetical protein PYW08_009944 [Mythimna loreyi]|uniref:Uncharacterized protein n=1 Tax=Mythimna loreyi TaxID=667449 RepID=A0ACC2Q5U4_9NEOP|nr:hypothetical protein PYW08_009944 [Mythimna loreyi]
MLVLTLLIVLYVSGLTSSTYHDRFSSRPTPHSACGVDRLQAEVQEGLGFIDSFPWLGLLIYPDDKFNLTTSAVILISNEIALSAALDIDSYPKEDFRARSRVVLGSSCTGPHIRVRDYAFHPDFSRGTFSTLALLQLDTSSTDFQLFPICAPPRDFSSGDEIYAMTVATDCYNSSMVAAYKMEHVESTVCREFYREVELDIKSLWPTHWVCAQSPGSQPCVWRGGTALVIRHEDKWKLLGVGIFGPGCRSPSRFLDYGMYHSWVTRVIAGIGQPTISRIAPNHLILRRTTNNIPRYGPCDSEESKMKIYSDKTTVVPPFEDEDGLIDDVQSAYFNVTLVQFIDYHCIVLQVWNALGSSDKPTIKIRRWCTGFSCLQPSKGNVDYYVEIKFKHILSSWSCGIDDSPVKHVSEGVARIETYPWLGVLYYPYHQKRLTTAVVLVTRQMVIATALEIDKLPKKDLRARARVVIGHNCSAGQGVGIRDYSYHHDYSRSTYSALVLIQLETDHAKMKLRPICPPPEALYSQNQTFFSMVLSGDCDRSKMTIHRMVIIPTEECQSYYRRAQLDIKTLWPTYTACAKSVARGECVWRSGAILVAKIGLRWSLLGFGVYGPGCQAPARFLDYGMYHEWVRRSVARIGRPAITKLAPNYVVLRRSLSNIQRFGPCDSGEVQSELYTELVEIGRKPDPNGKLAEAKYYLNLTIIADVEYSCIVLRANYKSKINEETPSLRLKRYCAGSQQTSLCFTGLQYLQILFYVEITFVARLKYSVTAYGRTVKSIDPHRAHKYANKHTDYMGLYNYKQTKQQFAYMKRDKSYPWYGKRKMKSRVVSDAKKSKPVPTTVGTKKEDKKGRLRLGLENAN